MSLGEQMGGQVVSASINASAKSLETLLKVLDRIFQLYKERSSVQYKAAKDAYKKQKMYDKYSGLTGFVAHDKLRKAGVPLTVANVHANEQQFERICELCKKQGVLISGVTDPSIDGTKTYTLEFKKEDAARIAAIVDFINVEEKANKIQDRINEIMENSTDGTLTGLSREDAELVKALNGEIHALQIQHTHGLNKEIVEKGVDQEFRDASELNGAERQDFFDVMNRVTENVIKQPMTYYILDSCDPDKYIECNSAPDTFNGKAYTHTNYTVYAQGEKVMEADDGRFEGRDRNFWQSLKESMKEAGGFGDQVIRFDSKEEMETYIANFKQEQQREVEPIKQIADKETKDKQDYENAKRHLVDKIRENGFEFDEETMSVLHKDGTPLTKEECYMAASTEEKVLNCEAYWNADLFRKFQELAKLEHEKSEVQAQLFLEPSGSVQHGELQARLNILESNIADTNGDIRRGVNVLNKINAMQCDAIAQRSVIREFTVEFSDDLRKAMGEYSDVEIDNLDAQEDSGLSMEEWEKLIEKRKQERESQERDKHEIGRLEYVENGEVIRSVEFVAAAEMLAELNNNQDKTINVVLYTDENEPFAATKDLASLSKAATGEVRFESPIPSEMNLEDH